MHKARQQQDHHIFNAVFKLIEDAQTTIVLDMFLLMMKWGHLKYHNGRQLGS